MITQKRIQLSVILFMLVLVTFSFASAITGNNGNSRMVLSEANYPKLGQLDGKTEVVIDKTISTKNVNNVSINITLKLDDDAKKFIELIDEGYNLQPNEQRNARFQVKVKDEGTYEGKINVFFSPAEGKEAGVVIPSTIIVIAKGEDSDDADVNDDTNDGGVNVITGGSIGGSGNKKSRTEVIFLSISTLILFVILIFLIYYNQKRLKLKKKKDIEIKKDTKKIKRKEKKDENTV